MKTWAALLRRDVRGLYRDRLLSFLTGYALGLAVMARVAVRWVPIPFIEVYVAPIVIVFAGALVGMVAGFTMIEERETGTWLSMRVLPVSQTTLTAYWMTTVTAFSLVVNFACAALYGLAPKDPAGFSLLVLSASLSAPLMMLLLGTFATNKIEGIAIGKIISGSALLLIIVFVMPPTWHLLLMWYPWYWIYVGLLRVYAGAEVMPVLVVRSFDLPTWTYVLASLVLQLAAIQFLSRRAATVA